MDIQLEVGETYITKNNIEVKIVDTKVINNKTFFIGLYDDDKDNKTPSCLLFYPYGVVSTLVIDYTIIKKKPKIGYAVIFDSLLFATREEAENYKATSSVCRIREIEL
jgi:hypothetical protein